MHARIRALTNTINCSFLFLSFGACYAFSRRFFFSLDISHCHHYRRRWPFYHFLFLFSSLLLCVPAQVHSKPLLVLVKLFYCSMIRLVFNMKISFLYCILEVCWIFELSLCWNVPWIDFKLSDRFTVSCQNYGKIFNEPISTNGIIFDIL